METKVEEQPTIVDTAKLGLAIGILLAALVAYYYFAETSALLRALGIIVALAPTQTIDDFHVGDGHGHNLKLLGDPTLLFRRVPAPAFASPARYLE